MHLVGCKWLPAFYIANGMGLGIGNVGYWKPFTLNKGDAGKPGMLRNGTEWKSS